MDRNRQLGIKRDSSQKGKGFLALDWSFFFQVQQKKSTTQLRKKAESFGVGPAWASRHQRTKQQKREENDLRRLWGAVGGGRVRSVLAYLPDRRGDCDWLLFSLMWEGVTTHKALDFWCPHSLPARELALSLSPCNSLWPPLVCQPGQKRERERESSIINFWQKKERLWIQRGKESECSAKFGLFLLAFISILGVAALFYCITYLPTLCRIWLIVTGHEHWRRWSVHQIIAKIMVHSQLLKWQ
jgi:hypothetical protein